MRHQNSVFDELLKHIPWDVLDRLVGEHGAASRVRRLNTKSQFVALLHGPLSGAASLREIVTGLASHAARLYHLGVRPVQRSTLADANAGRPSAVFAELFAELVKRAHRGLRRALGESVYLIDSSGLRLSEASAAWARFSSGVCGAKVDVIYDPDADHPIYAVVSAAKVNSRPSGLTRGHHCGSGNADRGRRDLRLRPRLLRLPLVGQAGCGGLPDCDPLQIQYPAERGA